MALSRSDKPQVRPGIDRIDLPDAPPGSISLYDSTGLTRAVITVSEAALWLIARLDGQYTIADIEAEFLSEAGRPVEDGAIEKMIGQLDQCLFLEGPVFEAHYNALVEHYRSGSTRQAFDLGLPEDGDELAGMLDEMLRDAPGADSDDQIVGLIAPHLDYARGRPCYADAYARIAKRAKPERIVIIGTNHSPRTFVPVASGRDFVTPLGRTRTDIDFIERLEFRCGDLRRCEYDHASEHSVDLQLIWCQHLFGADRFDLVPLLCPDPSTPRDAFPNAPESTSVAEVADALRDLLDDSDRDTLVIAGADLSHVGRAFGDTERLEDEFLAEVRRADEAALAHVGQNDADALVRHFEDTSNPTKVCSIGCVYMLMKALPRAFATVVGYHQAVHQESQTCVTCAAAVFRR